MKLTVYDKSNSHPALTYKGKRIITVCRDGSISREWIGDLVY